ncbi:hypothetical protein WNZ15_22660 [Roseibium sp. AS2]|uniref:hypothetical protein n=1 Tax=Roseibium sp. AS2 TaxID=3135781 RepID=UPI003172408B
MAGTVQFNRDVAEWGPKVKPWEKSEDVGFVISEILELYYPVGSLMTARISGNWLGEGEKPENNPETLDLMLQMQEAGGDEYVEIILRSTTFTPFYAGYLFGNEVEITDTLVNGHRVLISSNGHNRFRYEFDGAQYSLAGVLTLAGVSTNAVDAWRHGTKRSARARKAA